MLSQPLVGNGIGLVEDEVDEVEAREECRGLYAGAQKKKSELTNFSSYIE